MCLVCFFKKKLEINVNRLFQKMVCHGQHTYVYSQVIIQVLARESKGGSSMKRLAQEITKSAQKRYENPKKKQLY